MPDAIAWTTDVHGSEAGLGRTNTPRRAPPPNARPPMPSVVLKLKKLTLAERLKVAETLEQQAIAIRVWIDAETRPKPGKLSAEQCLQRRAWAIPRPWEKN